MGIIINFAKSLASVYAGVRKIRFEIGAGELSERDRKKYREKVYWECLKARLLISAYNLSNT